MDEKKKSDIKLVISPFSPIDPGTVIPSKKSNIVFGTVESWNNQSDLISEKETIYVYTDYGVINNKQIAGLKVGDGLTLLKDVPFIQGYVTPEQISQYEKDPTVPSWAKTPTRPVYTPSDVGAIPEGEIEEIGALELQRLWEGL